MARTGSGKAFGTDRKCLRGQGLYICYPPKYEQVRQWPGYRL